MKTKPKKSTKSKKSKAEYKGETPLGKALIAGLKEIIAHKQGKIVLPTYEYHPPSHIEVAPVRAKLGMSQTKFAHAFGLNVGTVRDWEQGRRKPDGMARILLAVIAKHPELVHGVLAEYQ